MITDLANCAHKTFIFYSKYELPDDINHWSHCLLPTEREKGIQFQNRSGQRMFYGVHLFLNRFLCKLLDLELQDLSFKYGNHGKPYIGNCPWHFNISHTNESWAMAFSKQGSLGIDIEEIQDFEDLIGLIQKYFHHDEVKYVHEAEAKTDAFYRIWTRKEALLKASGIGLTDDLTKICVLDPNPKHCIGGKIYQFELSSYKRENCFIGLAQIEKQACQIIKIDNSNYNSFLGNPFLL